MTLAHFLADRSPLVAIERLPDDRLINVVLDGGALYGVEVNDVPSNASVTRVAATYDAPTITPTTGSPLDAGAYTMLTE